MRKFNIKKDYVNRLNMFFIKNIQGGGNNGLTLFQLKIQIIRLKSMIYQRVTSNNRVW